MTKEFVECLCEKSPPEIANRAKDLEFGKVKKTFADRGNAGSDTYGDACIDIIVLASLETAGKRGQPIGVDDFPEKVIFSDSVIVKHLALEVMKYLPAYKRIELIHRGRFDDSEFLRDMRDQQLSRLIANSENRPEEELESDPSTQFIDINERMGRVEIALERGSHVVAAEILEGVIADAELPQAMHMLGQIYQSELIEGKGKEEARKLFTRAFNEGYDPAAVDLSIICYDEERCDKICRKAWRSIKERKVGDHYVGEALFQEVDSYFESCVVK